MKKAYLTPILVLSILPFLSSCASQEDVNNLSLHIRALNKKVEEIKGDPTVNQMQKRQASSFGQIDQLQADILQLKGQLEENAHMNRMLQEQNKELKQTVIALQARQEEELNSKLTELNNKIGIQEQSLDAIRKARIDDAKRRSKAAAIAAEEAMRKANAASAAQKTAGVPDGSALHIRPLSTKVVHSKISSPPGAAETYAAPKPEAPEEPENTQVTEKTPASPAPTAAVSGDYFSQGQEEFSRKQYKKAYTLFAKHAEKVSQQDSILARYMMGECLFHQGQYDQAIIQYQQIISSYPGNPQAAKALLKQGEAFEQLSDRDTAKIIYKKITTSYGSTPEAEIAKQRIPLL